MIRTTLRIALIAALAALIGGAALAQPDTGEADFTRYVALGDSITAGFQSGGLVATAQSISFPALLHQQATGSSTFEQPLVGIPGNPIPLQLVQLVPSVVIAPGGGPAGNPINLTLPRPYDNLGVPGARVRDTLLKGSGDPATNLVLRPGFPGFGGLPALQQALLLNPTFVTLWIGNNDALAAATSGIVIDGVTLTTLANFEADYRAIVGALLDAHAKLALATIPNVTSLPYVTTIHPFLVNPATNQPVLVNGQMVPLLGPNGPLSAGDHVLLPASAALAQGIGIPAAFGGTGVPLSDSLVLSADETATIEARVNGYNGIIRAVASDAGAAVMDSNALLAEAATKGITVGGIRFSAAFLSGGIFSYDGVHPTAFGYAFLANEFVKSINQKYSAKIPQLNLAPFIFGSASITGSLTAAQGASAIFTPAADNALRRSLGIPSAKVLERLKHGRDDGGTDAQPAPGPGPSPARPAQTPARNRAPQHQ
jgi:lysophospholipase L1-like esterase